MEPKQAAFTLKEGQSLGPSRHFKLLADVAQSPLGHIWRTADVGPGSRTTLSLLALNPTLTADTDFFEAFKKQITANKLIKHSHLLSQQGFFQLQDSTLLVMQEPIDGLNLAKLMTNGDIQKLSHRQLKVLLGQIAVCLDFLAKNQHNPHGALCPEFAFINRGVGIKLTGYGIRQALDDINDQLSPPLSYPHYQAPEAFHPGNVSAKSDIYSLACIAYQALTGERPFSVNSEGERERTHDKQTRNITDKQWLTLQRGLSDDPDTRPTSAPALIQALFIDEPKEESSDKESNKPSPDKTNSEKASQKSSQLSPNSRLGRLALRFPLIEKLINRPVMFSFGLLTGFLLGLITSLFYFNAPETQATKETANTLSKPAAATNNTAQPTEPPQHATKLDEITTNKETNPQSSDIESETRPSQTVFRDMVGNGIYGPEMVVIPAGKFIKGDDSNYADDNEKPAHEVNIQLAFALSRYEVTFDEYDKFAEITGRPLPSDENWGRGRRPVINVTWHDAKAYTEWLSSVTGERYRLPTESEWEYVAKAGSQSRYSWGDKIEPGYANCDECASQWGGQRTAPVGSFKPNAWGIYDMAGNVDEWSADCYSPNYNDSPTDGRASRTVGCSARAMRGGSWFDIARLMRPSSRYRNPAKGSRNSWGFRVVLDLKP